MTRIASPLLALASLVLFASRAPAADTTWSVTTAAFEQLQAASVTLDEQGAQLSVLPGNESRRLGWDAFLSAERAEVTPTAPGKFEILMLNGDRVTGEPAGIEGENLAWTNPVAGKLSLPLSQAVRVTKAGQPAPPAPAEPATEDVVTLANGDSVRGIVAAIGEGRVDVQQAGGDVVPVPLDSVVSLRFASTGQAPPAAAERTFRLRLGDGSTLTSASLKLTNEQAEVTLPGAAEPRQIPAATIAGVEQVNGPVAWLSSLAPAEQAHVPFLGATSPARMDRTVLGEPIRFGDETFRRGIGVHSRSRLTWPLDGRYKAFRTRYALDGDLPYADVTVRIKLDDKVVHERADFVAGEPSPVVTLPLGGAKSITLEVDYGRTYDVQDRFNWIEPALLKDAPPAK